MVPSAGQGGPDQDGPRVAPSGLQRGRSSLRGSHPGGGSRPHRGGHARHAPSASPYPSRWLVMAKATVSETVGQHRAEGNDDHDTAALFPATRSASPRLLRLVRRRGPSGHLRHRVTPGMRTTTEERAVSAPWTSVTSVSAPRPTWSSSGTPRRCLESNEMSSSR